MSITMNYIKQLKAENEALKQKIAEADQHSTDFMAFLQSSKFTGTETIIDRKAGWDNYDWVEEQSHEERKDWISTGDVLTWLQNNRTELTI